MKNQALLLILFSLWLAGCSEAPREVPDASRTPTAVKVVSVAEQSVPTVYETTGTVRARAAAVISSRLLGYVRDVKVKAGDRVQQGQLLIALDARDLDANSRKAQAALDEVRATVPEADHAVSAAKVNLDLAQTTFRRMQELWSKTSISNQEFDEASAKLKSAEAAYEMARARRAQLDTQAARVQQDVQAAGIARGYAEIGAPFAGVVTAKSVDPGTLAVPGAPLLTIEREGAYRLEASVEESRLRAIRVGQAVSVKLDGVNRAFESRVSEIVPAVDAASRSYIVKIDLPGFAEIRSGAFGRASFTVGMRPALLVPAGAMTERGQLQSVVTAENGIAHNRLITTGLRNKDQIEVLSGLTVGENVIFPVPPDLSDGAAVEIQR